MTMYLLLSAFTSSTFYLLATAEASVFSTYAFAQYINITRIN
jgi:hypothetical protein